MWISQKPLFLYGKTWFLEVWEASGGIWEASWRHLEASGEHLKASECCSDASGGIWRHLGGIWWQLELPWGAPNPKAMPGEGNFPLRGWHSNQQYGCRIQAYRDFKAVNLKTRGIRKAVNFKTIEIGKDCKLHVILAHPPQPDGP